MVSEEQIPLVCALLISGLPLGMTGKTLQDYKNRGFHAIGKEGFFTVRNNRTVALTIGSKTFAIPEELQMTSRIAPNKPRFVDTQDHSILSPGLEKIGRYYRETENKNILLDFPVVFEDPDHVINTGDIYSYI